MNSITDLNELFFSFLFYVKTWHDQFLVWNTTEYDEILELALPVEDVWFPDVNIANRYFLKYTLNLCASCSTLVKPTVKRFNL